MKESASLFHLPESLKSAKFGWMHEDFLVAFQHDWVLLRQSPGAEVFELGKTKNKGEVVQAFSFVCKPQSSFKFGLNFE